MTEKSQTRLRLYVGGQSVRSERAIRCVKALSNGDEFRDWVVEVVDAFARPDLAEEDKVIATPTLLRIFPKPEIRIVGDLSGSSDLRQALEIWQDDPEENATAETTSG